MSVREWAGKVLTVRFEEVLDYRGAALHSDDIEGIHDMRVATRRLRSAVRDFKPFLDKKPLKNSKEELKKIFNALGQARDQDVAIVALEELREKSNGKKITNGIAELISERRKLRREANAGILGKLSVTAINELKENFTVAVRKATESEDSDKAKSFAEAGREVIGERLKEFCELSENIYEPFIDKPLHKLRIAVKRLRYTIELYTVCWGEKLEPFADGLSDMQDHLGEVHDADIWLEFLSERLKNPANMNINFQAKMWLLGEFVQKRTENYRKALSLWSDWHESDFTGSLRSIISEDN